MAEATELGQQWLEKLLTLAGCPAIVTVEHPQFEQDPDTHWLMIQSADLTPVQVSSLLGSNGQGLDALQYLVNATLNLGQERQAVFTVELDGHRARRYQYLQSLAEQASAEVRQTGNEFEMPALSSTERRLLHTLFKDSPDLETFSRGEEPARRLIVRPRVPDAVSPDSVTE